MPKRSGMRKIVDTHSHLRESQIDIMAMFLSLDMRNRPLPMQGPYRPHTDKATVTRTGTLPPPCCGKGPKAGGESIVVLPGSPRNPAARLTGKGSDREPWKRAAIVVRGWESRPHGERRQVRKAFDCTRVEAP